MHIKAFENFSLGKFGGKNKKDSPAEKNAQASKIANMEAKINAKTKDIKNATDKLNVLKTDAGIALDVDIPVRPHGPAAELTLEEIDLQDNSDIKLDEVISDEPVTPGGEIKIAEVSMEKLAAIKAAPAASTLNVLPVAGAASATATLNVLPVAGAAPAEEKKKDKPDESDSLTNLFSQEEEEENPLQSLIDSLPDVSVRELLDDLAEINRIINEWKPNSK
jgi:hypothetical protein